MMQSSSGDMPPARDPGGEEFRAPGPDEPGPEVDADSAAAPDDAAAGAPPNREFLEKALDEALEAVETDEPLAGEELSALMEVCRRHAGNELTLEPIGVELVESLLALRLGGALSDAGLRREAASQIAARLFDAPQAMKRLETLWTRLNEAAA